MRSGSVVLGTYLVLILALLNLFITLGVIFVVNADVAALGDTREYNEVQ